MAHPLLLAIIKQLTGKTLAIPISVAAPTEAEKP
jgi:hypothetical protein